MLKAQGGGGLRRSAALDFFATHPMYVYEGNWRRNMTNTVQSQLAERIDPNEMVRYVQDLMTTPRSAAAADVTMAVAQRQWGDTDTARSAQLRWNALSKAIADQSVRAWTSTQKRDQIHVPAALIAAAGVARLKMADDQVVFDIPTLLDATLELCDPVGNA
jgi:hypothetical protein